MNICHISFVPVSYIGVKKKIDAQVRAFEEQGNKVSYYRYEKDGFYCNDLRISKLCTPNRYIRKIYELLIFFRILRLTEHNHDFAYVRYMRISPWFYFFLIVLKRKVKKLVVEIPSYPYDKEYFRADLIGFSDRFFRVKLKGIVDLFVYYGKHVHKIFDIDCLKIENGICKKENPLINREDKCFNKTSLHLIAVANFAHWHGYDRLLYSLSKEKDNGHQEKWRLHLVGSGNEINKLKNLTCKLGLDNIVTFHGPKWGEELDNLYNSMHIAICSLGLHRIGQDRLSPLKPAEYVARGLPIVLANHDERFKDEDFVFRCPNDESLIELKSIYDWYWNMTISKESIRDYAIRNLTWDKQIVRIINKINTLNKTYDD
ncbi:TPA: glycosyltransferase [Vibrio vulnificus]|nr:glycosyltransferase [Vibrio vulnificus]